MNRTSTQSLPVALARCLIAALLAPSPARADDEAPESVVRARTAAPTETVVGHAEIERSGGTTVADALRTSADVDLPGGGAAGAVGRLTLRGSAPEETLLLIDGLRVSSRSSAAILGGTDPNLFPSALVQQLVIGRGPTSALWGPNAVAGYVHITTREPVAPRLLTGTLQYGSYLSAQESGIAPPPRVGIDPSFEEGLNPFLGARGSVTAALRDADRYLAVSVTGSYSRGWFPNTEAHLIDGSFKLGRALPRGGTAYVWARAYDARTGAPSWGSLLESDAFDADDRQQRRGAQVAAHVRHVLAPRETLVFTGSASIALTRLFNPDADLSAGGSDTEADQRGSELQLRAAYTREGFGPFGTLTLGADLGHESLETEDSEQSALRGSVFVRDQRTFGLLTLDFACRLDGDTQYGWQLSPRLAAHARSRDGTVRVELAVGRGFRPPTFSERAWPEFRYASSSTAVGERGNALVAPESAWGLDAAAVLGSGLERWQVSARAFGLRTESFIRWSLDGDRYWTPTNVAGTVWSGGGSLDAQVRVVSSLTLVASGFWQTTRDEQGDEVSGRLRAKATGRAVWYSRTGLRAWVEALWFERSGLNSAGAPWRGVFANARVGWQSKAGLGVFVLGENLLDARFESARGLPSPGRTLWVGVALDIDED